MDKRKGISRFSVENFLSHSAEKFRRGILYCCSNLGYRKSLDKKGGVSRFSVENLCHSAENFRRRGGNAIAAGRRGYFLQTLATQNRLRPERCQNLFNEMVTPKIMKASTLLTIKFP